MAYDKDWSYEDDLISDQQPAKILDPCLDVVSKMLLSSLECREGLIDLITCIITPPSPIVGIEILNPLIPKQVADERRIELDLLLRLDNGTQINLEMQTTTNKILPNRALYHWAKIYSAQLKVGGQHPGLRPVRSIFLVKHPLYTADKHVAHHIIRAYREPVMVREVEHFRLDFVELSKLALASVEQPTHRTRLHLWAEFFMNATQAEAIEALMSDPIIKKTFDKLKEISAMDEAQQIARMRELGMVRYILERDEAREEGLEAGMQKGLEAGMQKGLEAGMQKGLEAGMQKGLAEGARQAQVAMIRKLIDGGMPLDQIAVALQTTKDELERLLAG